MAELPLIYQLHLATAALPAREVRGHEALSEPFRFEIKLTLPEGVAIDADAVVKSQASLVLVRSGVRRRIDGVLTEVFVATRLGGRPELTACLEPRFALARHRSNLKIFRDKSVPDIVAEVLGELGVSFQLRLAGSYPVRPYTVQYRETDHHFVSRMLEEEGMFYFFEEGDTMVIGDGRSAYSSVGSVSFRQAASLSRNAESIWAMGERAAVSVGQVSLRDWNLETPSVPMDVQASGPMSGGPEFYDYPGEYKDPGEGQRIANLTADSYRAAAGGVAGSGTVSTLAAGSTFSLQEGPPGIPRGTFAITRVEHNFHRERDSFMVRFEGLDAGTPFRPLRAHDEPVLPNPLTGVVTGPPGTDIHTDELGRVKVHFHWDRLQPYDDDCADWIPVVQDNTGHSVGVPRTGWEVLVHFMEGDPDRPLVLGRVYNAEDPFPVSLPANKSQTALKSLSSPSRDGSNLIMLEDRAGGQFIGMRAEKDQQVLVALDKAERIGNNEQAQVGRDETIVVAVDDHVGVAGDRALGVGVDQHVTIHGDASRAVAGDETLTVMGNNLLTVGSKHQRRVDSNDVVSAKELHERIGVANVETSVRNNTLTGSYGLATTVGGAVLEAARKDKTEKAKLARAETVGGLVLTKAKESIATTTDKKRFMTVGGALTVNAAKDITVKAGMKVSAKSLAQIHEAETISIMVGDNHVILAEDQIDVVAAKEIRFIVTGESRLHAEKSTQN